MFKKNGKKTKKPSSRFSLSPRAYLLLMLCLCIHILYNSLLLFCVHQNIIDFSFLTLHSALLLESQLIALMATVIGALLFDLQIKQKENRKNN